MSGKGRAVSKLLIPLTCIDFYFDEDDRLNDLLLKLNKKF